MFTGLIEGLGEITALAENGPGVDVTVRPGSSITAPETTALGDSVSINGCCLTVVQIKGDEWVFQAGTETLSKTNLGSLAVGTRVNLERAVRPTDRLGGHFVQGHVDGTGSVDAIEREGDWTTMWFAVPSSLTRQMVVKGSIAVDGISLTLVNVEPERFSVALIPHTLEVTNLGTRAVGDTVNIETDILGKYMEKMLSQVSIPPVEGAPSHGTV